MSKTVKKGLSLLVGTVLLLLIMSCPVEPEPEPTPTEEFTPPEKVWGTVAGMGVLVLEFEAAKSFSKGAKAENEITGTGTYTETETGDSIVITCFFNTATGDITITGTGIIGVEEVTINGNLHYDGSGCTGSLTINSDTISFAGNEVEGGTSAYLFLGIFGDAIVLPDGGSGYEAPLLMGDFATLMAHPSFLGFFNLFVHTETNQITGDYFTIDGDADILTGTHYSNLTLEFTTEGAFGAGEIVIDGGVINEFFDQIQGIWENDEEEDNIGWFHAYYFKLI